RIGRVGRAETEAVSEGERERRVEIAFIPEPVRRTGRSRDAGVQTVPAANVEHRIFDGTSSGLETDPCVNGWPHDESGVVLAQSAKHVRVEEIERAGEGDVPSIRVVQRLRAGRRRGTRDECYHSHRSAD